MLYSETKIAIGGLMRCCIDTIEKLVLEEHPNEEAENGETLQCQYTDDPLHRMILDHGVWRWDHD